MTIVWNEIKRTDKELGGFISQTVYVYLLTTDFYCMVSKLESKTRIYSHIVIIYKENDKTYSFVHSSVSSSTVLNFFLILFSDILCLAIFLDIVV